MGVIVPIVVEGRPSVTTTTTATIVKRPPLVSVGRRQSSRRLLLDGGAGAGGGAGGGGRRGSVGGSAAAGRLRSSVSSAVAAAAVSNALQLQDGRRGSVGGKKTAAEAGLARKGSGTGLKPLCKKASRSNLRTVQIKIQLEGFEREADKSKDEQSKDDSGNEDDKENRPASLDSRSTDQKKTLQEVSKSSREATTSSSSSTASAADKKRPAAVLAKKPAQVTTITRLDLGQVDRGLVNLRGRGEAGLEIAGQNSKRSRQDIPKEKTVTQYDAEVFSKFAKDALNSHNKYRARHGVQRLELDPALCAHAQKYAEKLARSCTFQHSGDPLYGENLYWGWSSDPNFSLKGWEPVDSWYEESLANYNYDSEPPDSSSGHFTQVVWATSRLLGVGLAKSPTGRHIVVMKYDPPGNFVGQYCQNVPRPVS